ncbi:MAG: hypothetical protein IIT35_04755, partial [Oscillospiraceae bacterium]|nr:hypothetical protein [Oscillospiraceae bacterium]
MAGAKASAEGKRYEDKGGKTDEKQLFGIYVLERRKRLESQANQRPQSKAHTEDTGDTVPEKSSSKT